MTSEQNFPPIITASTGYNGITILHELRGIRSASTGSFIRPDGKLGGVGMVTAEWRFYVIPRLGGFDNHVVVDHSGIATEVDLAQVWQSLSGNPLGILYLESQYPELSSHWIGGREADDYDKHPAVIRAQELSEKSYSPDYRWQWLCDSEVHEHEKFSFLEIPLRKASRRRITVPMVGGMDARIVERLVPTPWDPNRTQRE